MLPGESEFPFLEENQNRRIYTLPRPFLSCATPHKKTYFSTPAIKASLITAGLSLSKAVFVGDVAVGKTSLVRRFCHQIFVSNYKATIGVDFEVERFQIMHTPFLLQMWDTAGQERFKCIAQSYYRGATAIVLVFSLCDPKSLDNTHSWLVDALKANDSSPVIFLVGTKRDKISATSYINIENEAIEMANSMNAEYWSVSSKTGDCVEHFFNRLAAISYECAAQKLFGHRDHLEYGNPLSLIDEIESNEIKKKKSCKSC
ncbi:ras-related protein Rab-34-like [Arctopsyche grandis]|uniref:ras-related protein Rab-34-like n=1 Tax=Arctopsyche grandis TaxID=121162 RepID=UPI00406D9064